MNIQLRKLQESDREKYISLQRETWVNGTALDEKKMQDILWNDMFTDNEANFAIIRDCEICGFCAIKNPNKDNPEISIELYERYQNQGIGYLAILKLLEICQKEYHLNKVRSKVYADNYPSILLMRKVGAKPAGIKKDLSLDKDMISSFQEQNLELVTDNIMRIATLFDVEAKQLLSHNLVFQIMIPAMVPQFEIAFEGNINYAKKLETELLRFMHLQTERQLREILSLYQNNRDDEAANTLNAFIAKLDNQ